MNVRERLLGIVLLALGVVLIHECIYQPLEAAARLDSKISLSMKGVVLSPLFAILGAGSLILGKRATDIFGTREHPKPAAGLCGMVLALAGFGVYFGLKWVLEAKGYQF